MKRIVTCLAMIAISLAASVPLASAASLLESARTGNQQSALELINSGEDVNVTESNGTSALHWAVYNGDLLLIEQLIQAGADVNAINRYGSSPVSEAAQLGNLNIMQSLLEAGADPESPNADGQTALMIVSRSSNIEIAKLLLQHGADVNAIEQWRGQNAVIWASAQSQPEILQLLIDAGGDPNSRSFVNERRRMVSAERRFQWRPVGGLTALIYAAREGCQECTRILIEAGADIDQGDGENVTALLTAVINMNFDTAKYLVAAGANVNKWSLRGENPMYSAVDVNTIPHGGYPDRPSTDTTSSFEMMEILLAAGANPNLQLKLQPTYRHIKDDRGADSLLSVGATPLIRAAKVADVGAMELLLANGAHPNLPSRSGITPLMAAAGLGSNTIDTRGDYATPLAGQNSQRALAVMMAYGGDISATDNAGRTALHAAAGWGWNEAVSYLAAQGADLKAEDNNGLTPLDRALGLSSASGRGSVGAAHEDTAKLLQELVLEQGVE